MVDGLRRLLSGETKDPPVAAVVLGGKVVRAQQLCSRTISALPIKLRKGGRADLVGGGSPAARGLGWPPGRQAADRCSISIISM